MEEQKSNTSLKAIIVILAILLVGSLAFMYKMSTDSEKAQKEHVSERDQFIAELKAAEAQYNSEVAENTGLRGELEAEREKIQKLIGEVEKWKGDAKSLQRFKDDYTRLKREMDKLIAENKMLKEQNATLSIERDSTMVVLDESRRYNDTLLNQNENLSKTVQRASKLTIVNLKAEPFKERNSGKLIATEKARRVDLLKISFTIAANEVAQSGNKMYYVQVIDGKNNVLGEKQTETFGENTLTYSFITNAIYENQTMNVTETLSGKDFEKGTYYVNLFDQDKMVASSTFTLR
ncbi:hypothetical protein DVK85_09555 [Flavobacterium arcticum]|uniref:Chromosome partitioning protein ParA n=1 Tax=Flavobacterium arcticum TaxID=1784713 RepID=A0A345HD07_9FLAO|nr:hypothetical protein [Flavobacterium arcticum]AXG74467.1 hypothetical protein DVK85_09555 [Flavobacterium arcticum]KAF2512413.1 hypothetical protein E0W72_04110 [Flavobacterium arcticum]